MLGFSRHDTLYREARPKELQSQSLLSSSVNLQVSFPASKAASVVQKEGIRDHFRPSQETPLSDGGERRNPPHAGTKKAAIEIISLLSSDDSSSDDDENETDENDLLAERLQSLTLQPISIQDQASPSDSGPNYCAVTDQRGLCSPEQGDDDNERGASLLIVESPSVMHNVKLCSTPILFEEGGGGERENELEERSPDIDDDQILSEDNISSTPILKESSFSEHDTSDRAEEGSPEKQDISARIATTPILFDDGDVENEPSEQDRSTSSSSSSSSSEGDATSLVVEKSVSPSDQYFATTPVLCNDRETECNQGQTESFESSTSETASPNSSTPDPADRHNTTPILFENDEEVEHEEIVQEYCASFLDYNYEHDRFAPREGEYEPDDEDYSESIAQLDSSECENSCWIPELVEIQSLLQHVHDKQSSEKETKAALSPPEVGHFPRTDQRKDEVVEAASDTITTLNELGAGNRRRSSVDRFLNNCAQPDLFFSPPAIRNDCPPDSSMQQSTDSRRISLPSNIIDFSTVMKALESCGRDGIHKESSPEFFKTQQNFLDTPSEAVSRVIVHTMSKPAMPFICISSDSEARSSNVSNQSSISRDSILSVDLMADRFPTDNCTSPLVAAKDFAQSQERTDIISLRAFDSSEKFGIQRETFTQEYQDILGSNAISASTNTSAVMDCVEVLDMFDALQDDSFNSTKLKSDSAAYLNEQMPFERSGSSPCSTSIPTIDTKFNVLSSIPDPKPSSDDEHDTLEAFPTDTYSDSDSKDAMFVIDHASEETMCKSSETFPQPSTVPVSESAVDILTPARSLVEHDIPDALLSYSHLHDVVVEPFHLSIGDTIESAAVLVASGNRNMLSSLRSHGVVWDDVLMPLKPVDCLTAEEIRLYNDCIIEANAQDDILQAAVLFMRAISICDSDMNLHCKLAWICNTLKRRPSII